MSTATATSLLPQAVGRSASGGRDAAHRASGYPLSRFYLKPLAARIAELLVPTAVRPVHVTLLGAGCMLLAIGSLLGNLGTTSVAAMFVLAAWCCDRLDGELARRQGTVSAWGAWLDANLDELGDVGMHVAIAAAAAAQFKAPWPWWLLAAFLAGKYLFMYGLNVEESSQAAAPRSQPTEPARPPHWLRELYHAPANADIRLHALVLLLAWNALAVELAWVAVYYNFRWLARYVLVAKRLAGATR